MASPSAHATPSRRTYVGICLAFLVAFALPFVHILTTAFPNWIVLTVSTVALSVGIYLTYGVVQKTRAFMTFVNGHLKKYKTKQTSNRAHDFIKLINRAGRAADVDATFNIFLEGAQQLTGAKYAALSIFDDEGQVDKFFTLGMSEADKAAIGRLPEGKGLLGHVHEIEGALRLEDMSQHPKAVGLPPGHPPMKSLLAAPIREGNRKLGNIYLSKGTEGLFSEEDERLIQMAAETLALLIKEKVENQEARAYLETETARIVSIIDQIAAGDLGVELSYTDRGDDISRLYDRLSNMVSNFRGLIQKVTQAANDVAEAAAQISSAAEELSAGAHEQSGQSQDVAAAVEEMARTTIENANNTVTTASFARAGGTLAEEGGQIVADTVAKIQSISEVISRSAETVERLGESSSQIGSIVAVIGDIAAQTNLLSLNATIEAARAGDHGRGFGVVAQEVQRLAERTAEATKQIETMIKTIQQETQAAVHAMGHGTTEMQEGMALAHRAQTSLHEIVANVQEAVERTSHIAAASEEQSATTEQIAHSVEAISRISMESAAGVTQVAQSAEGLHHLTSQLQDLVSTFTLGQQTTSLSLSRSPSTLRRAA